MIEIDISSPTFGDIKHQLDEIKKSIEVLLAKFHRHMAASKAQFELQRLRRLASHLSIKSAKFKIFQSFKEIFFILSMCIHTQILRSFKTAMWVAIYIKTLNYDRFGTVSAVLKNQYSLNSLTWESVCQA